MSCCSVRRHFQFSGLQKHKVGFSEAGNPQWEKLYNINPGNVKAVDYWKFGQCFSRALIVVTVPWLTKLCGLLLLAVLLKCACYAFMGRGIMCRDPVSWPMAQLYDSVGCREEKREKLGRLVVRTGG